MTGIVDFRTQLLDETGAPIDSGNPLPVSSGGGGGGTLSDTVFIDSTNQLFVYRDTGSGVPLAYEIPSWDLYSPVGAVSVALATNEAVGVIGAAAPASADQMGFDNEGNLAAVSAVNPLPVNLASVSDATPLPVAEVNQEHILLMLTRMLSVLAKPANYDAALNRQRMTAILESGTVTTVTTVGTVTNLTNFGAGRAATELQDNNNRTAWALTNRARIT